MKKSILLFIACAGTLMITAQKQDSKRWTSDEAAVKLVIEDFLTAAGDYDIDAMPSLFAEHANIGGASFRNGKWNVSTMSLEEFMDILRATKDPEKYTEPVSKYTIHISEGLLAFVKADATLVFNGKVERQNFDYFTLIKQKGAWKILNGSYVSIPAEG